MMRRTCLLLILLFLPTLSVQAQDDLLGRINGLRASLGLPGYTLNGALSAAAQNQASWMASTGTVSHTQPDGSGPRSRAINAGYISTDVSENIYGGTNATAADAWHFWINSAIHYRGLTNARYKEVGIGIASTDWGSTFVLVFGNPGGPAYVPPSANSGSGASSAPPSYVLGVDEHGFILHEIQPDDTLGDIALIYGYTWADIPYMEQINGIADHFNLEVGSVFLVPPHDGTYTPTPGEAPTEVSATASPSPIPTLALVLVPSATDESTMPSPTPVVIAMAATAATMPEDLIVPHTPEAIVAAAPTESISLPSSTTPGRSPSQWLLIALLVQVGLLLLAGLEFLRRARRRS